MSEAVDVPASPVVGGGPKVNFTCAAKPVNFVKYRHKKTIGPLLFCLGVDFDVQARKLSSAKFRCKERILNGRVTVDAAQKRLMYESKPLANPLGPGSVRVQGGISPLGFMEDGMKPALTFSYLFGSGKMAANLTADGIDLRPRAYFNERTGVELCGNVQVPMPAAEFSPTAGGGIMNSFSTATAQVHLAQCNWIIRTGDRPKHFLSFVSAKNVDL